MSDLIDVLHVDDDASFAKMVATFLEREKEEINVILKTDPLAALAQLKKGPPDCIVSDFDMPEETGIEFLKAVRKTHPDLPFILFTGKGSEEVASEAITAGATDYLQKQRKTDQYKLLANRIENSVQQHRAQKQLERERARIEFSLESTNAAVWTRDLETDRMETHPQTCPVFNTQMDSFKSFLKEIHPADRSAVEKTARRAEHAEESYSVQFRVSGEGGARWGEMTAQTIVEGGEPSFQTGITRDITSQKEQARRFETLTNNLPGMVYRCENDPAWPMEDVRGSVEELSGYTTRELETDAVRWGEQIVHPADRDRVWESVGGALETCDSGGDIPETSDSFEVTYRIRTKDGTIKWVWERGRGIYGPDGELQAIEGFITDITAQKEREEELRRNERHFKALFNDPNILVGVLGTDGTVLDVNETAMQFVSADRSEIVDSKLWETPWWESEVKGDLKTWIERASSGEYVEYRTEHETHQGETIAVHGMIRPVTTEDGTVVSLFVSARELDEGQQSAETPDSSPVDATGFYQQLVENAAEGMLTIDEESRIVYANPAVEDILGYAPDELVGNSKMDIIPERLRPVHMAALQSYTETKERNIDWDGVELPALHKAGYEVPTLISLREHEHGGAQYFTGILRDVTERRKRENKLQMQKERLDEFAGVLAHDIRNPLSVARGYTELAREERDGPELEQIEEALDQIDTLVSNVLALSKEGEYIGDSGRVDVEDSIRRSWRNTDTRQATVRIVDEMASIYADKDRFEDALANLFRNAVEHAGEAVEITVGRLAEGDGIYIADDGEGIPESIRADVFDRGYSTQNDGTGYGLSIVKQIAEAQGWEVIATEADDGGARFEISGIEVLHSE